jgi:hypothetical protein
MKAVTWNQSYVIIFFIYTSIQPNIVFNINYNQKLLLNNSLLGLVVDGPLQGKNPNRLPYGN